LRDNRPGNVLGKPLLDIPDKLPALGKIGLARLRLNQLLDVLVAVLGVVALRAAGVALVEGDVWLVERRSG
jgi:hypothetical protein